MPEPQEGSLAYDSAYERTLVIPSREVDETVEDLAPPAPRTRDHWYALSGAVLVVVGVFSYSIMTLEKPQIVVDAALLVAPVVDVVRVPDVVNPYTEVPLEARAAIVYDVHAKKVLFGKNATTPMPLASLTKLMTTLVAVKSADEGTRLAVSQHSIDTEGDSGLLANESWKLSDLLSFMLITSSNDGADAIAAAVGSLFVSTPAATPEYEHVDAFVDVMNATAGELGFSSMQFRNATGLDEPNGGEGGVGSAEDMAELLTYIWKEYPQSLEGSEERERTFVSEDGFVHDAKNTNDTVDKIPGLLGSKTGYTHLAGGNLAVVYDAGLDHPIVIVVMGSSIDGRFTDVQSLVDATYAYVESGWYEYEVAGSTPTDAL